MINLTPVQLVFLLSDYVVIALAFVIAYIAYKGYRRNNSRPMIFIAVGFAITFGVPGGVFLLAQVIPIPTTVVGGITQGSEIIGMLSIVYGFVAPVRREG